ncbi:hypothetical protein OJAV_G00194690 [Oryzias javanicus]|uniref:Uncharacterized protein n=1 Tax=Oryzias javanicus TaxID=123683 RepID=A0A437CCE8_ORYJA|nr:hypothetical protein OJAV_G00194690 [Oryzias javanicus]
MCSSLRVEVDCGRVNIQSSGGYGTLLLKAASPSAATATTPSTSSSASSPPGVAAKAAHRFTAFVSGRRSLSVVEMQAKVKKLVGKPASPASSTPACSSTTSEEPTDEELVSAVVDIESSQVQAPLLLRSSSRDEVPEMREQPAPAGVPPPASAGDAEVMRQRMQMQLFVFLCH